MTNQPSSQINWWDFVNFTDKQKLAYKSVLDYKFTLYGGSRGPGKSYWLRWSLPSLMLYWAGQGIGGVSTGLFSDTYASLKDRQISKIAIEFPDWLGELKETKSSGLAFNLHERWGGGSVLLRNLDDPTKYKSSELGAIAIDELTEHPVETFNVLLGSLRWPGVKEPKFLSASNPDGVGNVWVKDYFINHIYPPELQPYSNQFNYVKALPEDNPHLDESYWIMLNSLPHDLKEAWLHGNWDVFSGRAFRSFDRDRHIVEPFDIPDKWTRLIGIDSGYRAPFCALFGARNPDNGRVVIYKEIYETELTDRQQARKIMDLSDDRELRAARFADPSMWVSRTQNEVTSSALIFAQNGCYIRKADNNRINGKRKIDRLLLDLEDGKPGLLIFENCTNLIKQMLHLVYDKYHPEDVDTTMEDHAYDAARYLLTSVRDYRKIEEPKYQKSPFTQLSRI